MDPFFARNRLSAYLDGALDDSEAAEVAAAIEADPSLRDEFEELQRAVDLLRTHGPAKAPDGFHARLMARIEEEPAQGGVVALFRRTFAQVPVEALALVAAALVVVIVIQGRPGDETSVVQETATRSADVAQNAAPVSKEPKKKQAKEAAQQVAPEGDLDRIAQSTLPAPTKAGSAGPASSQGSSGYGTKSSSSKLASGSDTPTEAYVPEWETQGLTLDSEDASGSAAEESSGLARPKGYAIRLSHPRSLYDLQSLAQKAGGRLTDSSGQPLVPRALTYEDNFVVAVMAVPAEEAASVEASLTKELRAVPQAPSGSTPLFGPNQSGFVVEVHYMP